MVDGNVCASLLRILQAIDGNVCASLLRILRVIGGDTIFLTIRGGLSGVSVI